MTYGVNNPAAVAWVVLAVFIFGALVVLGSVVRERTHNRRKRVWQDNDDIIFKTLEEARRDFV